MLCTLRAGSCCCCCACDLLLVMQRASGAAAMQPSWCGGEAKSAHFCLRCSSALTGLPQRCALMGALAAAAIACMALAVRGEACRRKVVAAAARPLPAVPAPPASRCRCRCKVVWSIIDITHCCPTAGWTAASTPRPSLHTPIPVGSCWGFCQPPHPLVSLLNRAVAAPPHVHRLWRPGTLHSSGTQASQLAWALQLREVSARLSPPCWGFAEASQLSAKRPSVP